MSVAPIYFNDDAIDSLIGALDGFAGWHVDIERAEGYEGYGSNPCAIVKARGDGLTICEVVDHEPVENSTWLLPYEGIVSVTIL